MGNIIIQRADGDSNGQNKPSTGQEQGGAAQTDTTIAKRTAVRQELAIALMAVGGVLLAALIWANFSGNQ